MRLTCPGCGRRLKLPTGATGGLVGCPSCGARIDLSEVSPVAAAPPPTRAPPTAATRQPGWAQSAVVGIVVAALTAAAMWATRPSPTPPPPPFKPPIATSAPSRTDELLAIKQSADAAADRGDRRAAYDGYGRLLAIAAEQATDDPAVRAALGSARARQDQLFAQMTAARATPIAPRPAPVSMTPPTTTPATPGFFASIPSASHHAPATAPSAVQPATMQPVDAMATADAAPPVPHPPPPPRLRAYTPTDGIDDDAIGSAIERGVAFLEQHVHGGEVETGLTDHHGGAAPPLPAAKPADDSDLSGGTNLGDLTPPPRPAAGGPAVPRGGDNDSLAAFGYTTPGIDALCTYALLHAGQAVHRAELAPTDAFADAMLERLKSYPLRHTYHRSLRAAALAVYARRQDVPTLEDDVRWLVGASRDGAYWYTPLPPRGPFHWDNSNSQYGLLGVWSAAGAGVAVPSEFWRAVQQHWVACGQSQGTWGYDAPGATLSMTCAGIASLLVSHEYLDGDALMTATAADQPSPNPLASAGLARLDEGDTAVAGLFDHAGMNGAGGAGYALYGLERVGLASGFKFFGSHDWYAELARTLVHDQQPDGSWSGAWAWGQPSLSQTEIDTAYALLFLARGRHPVLFNKLRYDGAWNGRPHDVEQLARLAAKQLERPFNWQVVSLRRDWHDWMDSPVLYIAGQRPPKLSDADEAAIRSFARAGGLIFTHADGGSPAFTVWVRQFAHRLFPDDPFVPLPPSHPLNSALYRLQNGPLLEGVSNGSRLLLVHSPTDLAGGWHRPLGDETSVDAQVGLNVFVYAAGRTDFKNRQASTYVPPLPGVPDVVRPVARLRYAGRWDPEPYAWTRFARYYQWETHDGLDVQTVDLSQLRPGRVPLAVLTGTVRQAFTPAEAAAVRAYVDAGGVLLVDACGGQPPFAESATALLSAAFPGVPLAPLPPDHPLRVPSRPFADDLRGRLPLRPFAADRLGTDVPLQGLRFGRGWVIFSRLDLTTGLLGTQEWGILGYDPAYASAVVKNAVLWAAARSAVGPR
jgi:hypothetical protein